MRQTVAAEVRYLVYIVLAGSACRRYYLHERSLVVDLVYGALVKSVGDMYGLVGRTQGKSHGKPCSLSTDGTFLVDVVAELGCLVGRYLVRQCLQVVLYVLRVICDTCDLDKNAFP